MPCHHKFQSYLNLDRLDFVPETLIVGTFNPAWPEGNYAPWFYGRTGNNYFWDVLPRIYNPDLNLRKPECGPNDWKQFCRDHRVAITDLIYDIEDADAANKLHRNVLKTYSDASISKQFRQIVFTDIIGILHRFRTIRQVYLTTQAKIELFNQKWTDVEDYGSKNGIKVRRLLTPSASARFQMGNFKIENPNDKPPLRNFIYRNWLEVWHFSI